MQEGVVRAEVLVRKAPPVVRVVQVIRQAVCRAAVELPFGGFLRVRPDLVEERAVAGPEVILVDFEYERRASVAHVPPARPVEFGGRVAQAFLDVAVLGPGFAVGAQLAQAEVAEEPGVGEVAVEVDVNRVDGRARERLPLPPSAVGGPEAGLGRRSDAVHHRVLEPVGEGVIEAHMLPLVDSFQRVRNTAERFLRDVARVRVEVRVVVAYDLAVVRPVREVPSEDERHETCFAGSKRGAGG